MLELPISWSDLRQVAPAIHQLLSDDEDDSVAPSSIPLPSYSIPVPLHVINTNHLTLWAFDHVKNLHSGLKLVLASPSGHTMGGASPFNRWLTRDLRDPLTSPYIPVHQTDTDSLTNIHPTIKGLPGMIHSLLVRLEGDRAGPDGDSKVRGRNIRQVLCCADYIGNDLVFNLLVGWMKVCLLDRCNITDAFVRFGAIMDDFEPFEFNREEAEREMRDKHRRRKV